MTKQTIRVSNAIPDMPPSFDLAVERTLRSVCRKQQAKPRAAKNTQEREYGTQTVRKETNWQRAAKIAAYAAAAVLLVGMFALGAVALHRSLYGTPTQLAAAPTERPETPEALSPAIRFHGLTYIVTGEAYAGEIDESVIRTTASRVPLSEWPTEEGQTNWAEEGTPYAMTADGLFVRFGEEWRLCEPMLPDAESGPFEAAYAQTIIEQYGLEKQYAMLEAGRDGMTGEELEALDQETDANEFFIHQRLVRLQLICDTVQGTVRVNETDGDIRLDEIAYADGKLYFAFAAPKIIHFDGVPVIFVNGSAMTVIDDTEFFALAETETEHYAFYEIGTGQMKGARRIAADLGSSRFCFLYDADSNTVALPQDETQFEEWFNGGEETVLLPTPAPNAAAEPGVPCAFVTAEQYVEPYMYFAYHEGPGSAADGISLVYQMQAEGFRSQLRVMTYYDDLAIESPYEIVQINVYDENGARIAFDTSLDYLKTLAPGLYYVSALVRVADGDTVTGYDCVCGVAIGITAPQEPDASATPKPDLVSAVRFNGTTYRMTGESYVGEILLSLGQVEGVHTGMMPFQDSCANFGEPGMGLALISDGLVVDYGGWKRLEPMYPQMDGPAVAGYTVPAIRYQGVLYLWTTEEDGSALAFNDEYICYSLSSAVSPGQWPMEEEQINFDGLGCKVAETKDGLLIEYQGKWLLFRPTQEVPAVFRQGSDYIVPYWDMVAYSSPEFEGDGVPLASKLKDGGDRDLDKYVPTVRYTGKPIDVTPRGWTLESVYMIDPDGDRVWEAAAGELELMEACYELPMTPIVGAMMDNEFSDYYLCALMRRTDGDVTRHYECVIHLTVG